MPLDSDHRPIDPTPGNRGARWTLFACLGVVAAMTGLTFASAPLYDLFCKATGYEGTPRVGAMPESGATGTAALKPLTVRFDTNVAPNLPWRFKPETGSIALVPGESKTVFFKVENTGPSPVTGISTFNVTPGLMGSYFVKVKCFCFEEQTLQPGETMEFPLVFYIDPKLREDADIPDISEMTLSYTYFVSKKGGSSATRTNASRNPGNSPDRTNF